MSSAGILLVFAAANEGTPGWTQTRPGSHCSETSPRPVPGSKAPGPPAHLLARCGRQACAQAISPRRAVTQGETESAAAMMAEMSVVPVESVTADPFAIRQAESRAGWAIQ